MCLSLYMNCHQIVVQMLYMANRVLCRYSTYLCPLEASCSHSNRCALKNTVFMLLTLPLCIHFIVFHVQCCNRVFILIIKCDVHVCITSYMYICELRPKGMI